ncbi:MAG: type II secretion system F family protein [Phycisphaerae bacterium]|nr:type II secretion system F family protein [Phycisphaerae bacterium]
MPVFSYRICDADGASTGGLITADTAAAGRQTLREQGFRLVEFKPARALSRPKLRLPWRRRGRAEQIAEVARQLAMLLRAGVPLSEALGVLIEQWSGAIAAVLRDVRDRVSAGASLSESLQQHEGWFDPMFCSAVRVGELSGHLDRTLTEVAEFLRERQTIRTRVASAFAYPAILAVLGTGVVLFLMSYVIPQLLAVLEASGKSLPLATRVLKRLSDFLIATWPVLLLAGVAIVAGWAALIRWKPFRRRWHALQLGLPVVGILLRKVLIANFAQTMCMLLRSGVTFVEALRLVHDGARHLVLVQEVESMAEAIRRGSDIAPSLRESRIFPPLVGRVMAVGQNTGELPEMLQQLKEGYESEVRLAVGRATAVLEPLMIVVMSAIVGFVVFATMMPILEATKVLQS